MRIALYEPDIPQNTGTILRLAACLGIEAHIIEPAGFPTSDQAFRRAGMDYLDHVALVRHISWDQFESWRRREKLQLVLFSKSGFTDALVEAATVRTDLRLVSCDEIVARLIGPPEVPLA